MEKGRAKPNAPKEDRWVNTACNMCFNACGIRVHVEDGVVTKIEGNPESPVGEGTLCGKGASGIMQLYDPSRITKPMKRTNPRKGRDIDPGWVEISWEEAYQLAADHIKPVIEENPLQFMGYGMVTNNANLLPFIWWTAVAMGGHFLCSDICGAAIHPAYERYTGTGNSGPDYEMCRYLLQFGTQAGVATRHGFNMSVKRLANGRDKGLHMVSVDPHMGTNAEKADEWVPIRPGTDGAMSTALCYVLVHELGIYDREYLKRFTNSGDLIDLKTGTFIRHPETGKPYYWSLSENCAKTIDQGRDSTQDKALTGTYQFEDRKVAPAFQVYADSLKTYTPEWAEPITTVPAATIRRIAKEFGEAARIGSTITIEGKEYPYRPACADCFSGVTRHKHAHLSCWSILSLNVLVGSCNVPGGLIGFGTICDGIPETGRPHWEPGTFERDEMLEHCSLFYPLNRSIYQTYSAPVTFAPYKDMQLYSLQPFNKGDAHFDYIVQMDPERYKQNKCKVLFCYAGNPGKNWGDYDQMGQWLNSFEYMISCDIYLNDSSYFADLILPEACYLERMDAPPNGWFNHHTIGNLFTPWALTMRQPVVPSQDNLPGGMDIFIEIAYRCGVLPKYLGTIQKIFGLTDEHKLDLTKKYTWKEVMERSYECWSGKPFSYFEEHGLLTWERKVDEIYLYPYARPHTRIPIYLDFAMELGRQVKEQTEKYNIPWQQFEDFTPVPVPGWRPCKDYEIKDKDYDMLPVYYTNNCNVDTWGIINPYIDEINECDPYGYNIEINAATAERKGLKSGDIVRIETKEGRHVDGRIICVEGVHPEVLGVGGGCWDIRSKYIPNRNKGAAVNSLLDPFDPDRYDHVSAAFDACVRCKISKLS